MQDKFGRKVNYLRLSLTDQCNMNCFYCRPQRYAVHDVSACLTTGECERLARIAVSLGITRFKLTGGEPLLRAECVDIVRCLKQVSGVEQVTLTTNGSLFAERAEALRQAGLDSVTFSLDTTDAAEYHDWTGGQLQPVLAAIEKAQAIGLSAKLNTVVHERTTLTALEGVLKLAERYQLPLRFIEEMPLVHQKHQNDVTMMEKLRLSLGKLTPWLQSLGNGPAQYYHSPRYAVPIGFIKPLHGKFCQACNRVRITAVGELKTCLYAPPVLDVKALLQTEPNDAKVAATLRSYIYDKPKQHSFELAPGDFALSEIGG